MLQKLLKHFFLFLFLASRCIGSKGLSRIIKFYNGHFSSLECLPRREGLDFLTKGEWALDRELRVSRGASFEGGPSIFC